MGAGSHADEHYGTPLSIGGFGTAGPTLTSGKVVRLSVQFCDGSCRATAHATVDAIVLPASGPVNVELLLGCDSFGRFDHRAYQALPNTGREGFGRKGTLTLKNVGLTRAQYEIVLVIRLLRLLLQRAPLFTRQTRTSILGDCEVRLMPSWCPVLYTALDGGRTWYPEQVYGVEIRGVVDVESRWHGISNTLCRLET